MHPYLVITYKIHFHFPMRKVLNKFSAIPCNSTIAPNKQILKHNNLATIQRKTNQGSLWCPRALNLWKPRTKLQTLTTMDIVIIEDYYHMTTIDEYACWMKWTHLLWKFPLHLRASIYISTFVTKKWIKCATQTQHISLMYAMYTNASIIPLLDSH
jgi:hypothetical protein